MTVPADAVPMDEATRAVRRITWPNLLRRHAFQLGDRTAIRWQGTSISWREFDRFTDDFADALYAAGVRAGDRVALLMLNRPEFIYATIGAQRIGAVVVPVNFRFAPPELAHVLGVVEPAVVVVDAPLLPGLQAALATAAQQPVVVTTGASEPVDGVRTYAQFASGDHPAHPLVDVAENDAALIMFTSGTTGRPKGATLSHLNMHGNGLTCVQAWNSREDDITLLATPLFHIGGIGVCSGTLLAGSSIVLQETGLFDAGATLDLMERERVTGTFLVPAQWQTVVAEQERQPRDICLRVLSWGAAPATEHLLRQMSEVFPGGSSIAVFGQSEMSPITCVLHEQDAIRKLGSVGRPISTLAVRVLDALGNDVAPGEVGEIVYRGPTQMMGYWRDQQATADAFVDGWFRSGDLVRIDDEGFVFVVDRTKDMVISGGENIYCLEVENVLAEHPDILEVTVVGGPHPTYGETPVAVAVIRAGTHLTLPQLREWADGRIARYKLPTELHLVDALPRNPSGKVLKSQLRQEFSAETSSS